MHALRFVAIAFALLTLYYARFFLAVRQETATLVQIGILLAAAAVRRCRCASDPLGAPGSEAGGEFRCAAGDGHRRLGLAVTSSPGLTTTPTPGQRHADRALPDVCLIAAVVLRIADHRTVARL